MNKSRGGLESLRMGLIFSVTDEDEKHFNRFEKELTRLGLMFFVNFDHCGTSTLRRFRSHPLYGSSYENSDPKRLFDESHRQNALSLLMKTNQYNDLGFDWALAMDVDETLEDDAPEKIRHAMCLGADVIDFPVLDLWGDPDKRPLTYRADGVHQSSHREKMFNLRTAASLRYTHPAGSSPRHRPCDQRLPIVERRQIHVLHWGIMNPADVRFHTERWERIYKRSLGSMPTPYYDYLNDPATVPDVREVPKGICE